ncbi:transcription termination/antitermination protein NusG [Candidatus Chazhemtobacterium aquaticus]|uniref:Transcription termination/antitermination protein NusG n=1 Tax=Candidatus Chazhemtobacterium aquaticus TaxID=2715735 RepID=A0A857ND95_9BACT|nr:transcription termination/antitermination protein NusG [Candidatus Chazhemtobacterium aquaticus]QHO63782.1 Transcription antitermination protein NusG [Candidatus Chazhemtobacterium aquaticus]
MATKKSSTIKKIKKVKKTKKSKLTKANPHHLIISKTENPKAHWYVIHTYAAHELKTAKTLEQKVLTLGLDNYIKEILIPTQEKIKINKGKKSTIQEKIFPGYLLIRMEVNDDSWLAVRTTQGITGFVGTGSQPTRLPQEEVDAIKKFISQETPKFQASFSLGEAIKIVEGPFADMLGTVNKIDEDKGKVTVLVSIFGRETPVELDFLQVSKI